DRRDESREPHALIVSLFQSARTPPPLFRSGLSIHRPFNPRAQIGAVLPVDDALRKVMCRILEHDARPAHFLQWKRSGRRSAVRHREVDDSVALLLDA